MIRSPDPVLEAVITASTTISGGDGPGKTPPRPIQTKSERFVRCPARAQIPKPEEELEGQAALHRPPSGRSSGNRIVSRIDG